ncbi:MAG: hypothetical protein JXO22_15440 [Phycisphaerae bacterium]|nr:hypothetical protein [Phycisphaerae bacterium]
MTSKPRPVQILLFAVLLSLGVCAGCSVRESGIQILSHRDPADPELFTNDFDQSAYIKSAHGDYDIVAESMTVSRATGSIRQYLHLRLYWRPHPGLTFADKDSTNATVRYVILADGGLSVYEGTGFVYPKRRRDGTIIALIERTELHPAEEWGDAPVPLGEINIRGELHVDDDASRAVNLLRELDQLIGTAPDRDWSASE